MKKKSTSQSLYDIETDRIPESPEGCYNYIINEIQAAPLKDFTFPYQGIGQYFFEAEELGYMAVKHRNRLIEAGFALSLAHTAIIRARAGIHADILYNGGIPLDDSQPGNWTERSPEAFAIRTQMVRLFKLVYKSDPVKKREMQQLNTSRAMGSVLQDITTLCNIGRDIDPQSTRVVLNPALFDSAEELVNELSGLQATIHFASIEMKEKKNIRDRIITLLKDPVIDIRDWADVAFGNVPSIRKQFNSEYCRKKYLKGKRGRVA
ncbi:MAG: hypothetical protein OCD01_05585 [Fibrobacterales bacterium]